MADPKQKGVTSSLSKLSLNSTKSPKRKSKKEAVADSWEDELGSSESESENTKAADREGGKRSLPSAPPPTPMSPSYGSRADRAWSPAVDPTSSYVPMSPDTTEARRPEKTDAVARRMIAGALGMRAPKRTEEQKAYDKSVREQAKKKLDEQKAAERRRQEEAEKAKAAMWED